MGQFPTADDTLLERALTIASTGYHGSKLAQSRLAEFGGRGMSFNICHGTPGSLVMDQRNRYCRGPCLRLIVSRMSGGNRGT